MALRVTSGFLTSSIRYKIRREGSARNTSTTAGRTVHTVSTVWAENLSELRWGFLMREIALTPTTDRMSLIMNRVWSWNCTSCLIKGLTPSWGRVWYQFGMSMIA